MWCYSCMHHVWFFPPAVLFLPMWFLFSGGFFPWGQIWGQLSPKFRQNRYFIVADPAVASHRSTDHRAVINVLGSVSSIYGVS